MASHDAHLSAESPLGFDTLLLDRLSTRAFNIGWPERVAADSPARWVLDPNHSALLANLNRNVSRDLLCTGRRGGVVSWRHYLSPDENSNSGTLVPASESPPIGSLPPPAMIQVERILC